jgi:hypothetical protein
LEKLVEDFLAGDVLPGAGIRARGVLCQFSCSIPEVAYTPWVTGTASERIKGRSVDPKTGRELIQAELLLTKKTLSPPVNRLNDVVLRDGSGARIGWLYPDGFTGLVFGQKSGIAGQGIMPADVFTIKPEQQPVLCLLPTNGQHDSLYGCAVETVGRVVAADPETVAMLSGSLDQFRIEFLARCIRPFEATSMCLAIDLRDRISRVTRRALIDKLNMVIGVQALVDVPGARENERDQIFVAAVDAVPDRAGLGPVRAFSHSVPPGVYSIVTRGGISWVFDQTASTIGAYREVNLADREETVRSSGACSSLAGLAKARST